jgi:hypothetical protein
MLEASAVYADASTPIQRFIGLYHPHGCAHELWLPQGTEQSFSITYDNCSLQPFDDATTYGTSFKDKIIVVDGIDLMSNANGHDTAGNILTGCDINGKRPSNSSLDQFLAVDQGLGATTRMSSIVLGVGNNSTDNGWSLSFSKGSPLPKIIDPSETFNKTFGALMVGNDAAAQAAAARKRKLGQSVIDFIRADVTSLQTRLGATEKLKLDQHLTSIRELEKQLTDFQVMSCTVPTAPDSTTFPKLQMYNGGEPYFDVITNLQIDLLAQAMACDITRFGTLFMNDLSHTGYPLGLPDDVHQGVAHVYDGSHDSNYDNNPYAGTPTTWTPLAKMNKYSYGKAARLLQKLQGFGILDTTLVYMSSDMGNPALHSTRNAPTILAGGVGGKWRMGRYLQLKADCPPNRYYCSGTDQTTIPNNRLLISIASAFGVTVDSYGSQTDPTLTQGQLDGLI